LKIGNFAPTEAG